jgi:4-hydroxy-tetrahydrodipicolinate synthase
MMPTRSVSAFTCTVTPFDESGALDLDALAIQLERISSTGMGVYLGSASPGEGHALTAAETEQLYGTAVDLMKGKAPVRAMGVEPRHARQMLEIVAIAERAGIEAMQLYSLDCGHGNVPREDELEAYFDRVLDALSIPGVISSHMYNGYVLPLDMVDRLLTKHDNIAGFNVTNTSLPYVTQFVDVVDGRAAVAVGGAMQALTILALGGQGFLCTDGNIIPAVCMEVIRAHERDDHRAALDAYATVMRFFSLNRFPGGSMRFLKSAMRTLGLPGHHLRDPFKELTPDEHARVAADLERLDVRRLAGLAQSR